MNEPEREESGLSKLTAFDKEISEQAQAKMLEVENGSTVVYVTDDHLAAALVAVGVPFQRPAIIRRKAANGKEITQWMFSDKNVAGDLQTKSLIKEWNRWERFISVNPSHPFTFAICAVKNLPRIQEIKRDAKPYVSFRHPNGTHILHVSEGSKRHTEYVLQGLKQL